MAQSFKADSSSGVATVRQIPKSGPFVQVSLLNASGSGTVTLTVLPGSKIDAFEEVTDGTIDVGSPSTVTITGWVSAVKATSSNSGDTFTLEVVA